MAHQCTRIDCTKDAEFCLKLLFYDPLHDAAAEAFISFNVCAEHRASDELVASNVQLNWPTISRAFLSQGYTAPQFENTRWLWVPIAEMEEPYKESVKKIQRHWDN